MFKNGIIVLMIATTMVVSSTAQDGYKVGIEFTHKWDEMDQEESNGPKHQLLRNHIAKYNQDQSDENVGGGKVYGEYNKGPVKAGGEYTWDEDANDDVGGGKVYGEYNKGPVKAGGEYNWDEDANVGLRKMRYCCQAMIPQCFECHQRNRQIFKKSQKVQFDENVGGGRVYGEYNKGPYKAGAEYNWDEDANVGGPGNYPPIPPPFLDEAEENVGGGRVYGEYNKGPYKAGAEYNWDEQVGQPHGYTTSEWEALDEAEENVGGGRVYGEYNKGPYKAGAEYNWDEAEENVGAAPHWTVLKWLIKADMKRCTACGGLCEKTMMDKRTKMCHCVQDARCMVDCRNGGDCLYRGNRRLSTTVKRRKLGMVTGNCYFTQQRLCGYCGGSNECREKCNKKHEKKLREACGFRRLMHSVKNGSGRSLRRRLIKYTPAVRYMADNCKWGCKITEKQFIKKFGKRDAMYAINNKGSINYK